MKMTLSKEENLSIVVLYFDYLTQAKGVLNPSKKGLRILLRRYCDSEGITLLSSQCLELKPL